jgi:hypothetical protein
MRAASKETPKTSASSRIEVTGFAKRWFTAVSRLGLAPSLWKRSL